MTSPVKDPQMYRAQLETMGVSSDVIDEQIAAMKSEKDIWLAASIDQHRKAKAERKRADTAEAENAKLREALRATHKALAMMIDPATIGSTSVANAFATALEAEVKARAVLEVKP